MERVEELEDTLRVLHSFAKEVVEEFDCDCHEDYYKPGEKCFWCKAKEALRERTEAAGGGVMTDYGQFNTDSVNHLIIERDALAKRVEELQLQHLEALEREAQMKVERDDFESEWATASKRVEELETLLWKLHDEEMHSVSAHIYSAARNAVWHEAVDIAERRAGRAKYLCECGKRNETNFCGACGFEQAIKGRA